MRRLLALSSILLLLAACSDKNAKSWIGQPVGNVMGSAGAPDLESRTGDGGRVLTWYGRNGYGQVACRTNMRVDREDVVTSASSNCL